MLCDRRYCAFPQHLNQGLGTPAYSDEFSQVVNQLHFLLQMGGSSTPLPCGRVYMAQVQVIPGNLIRTRMKRTAKGERREGSPIPILLSGSLCLYANRCLITHTGGRLR